MSRKIIKMSARKISAIHNEHGYMCDKCGDRSDVRTLGRFLCAICYLLDVAPERVDKLKRKII
jgi:uncharacterized protein YlaI